MLCYNEIKFTQDLKGGILFDSPAIIIFCDCSRVRQYYRCRGKIIHLPAQFERRYPQSRKEMGVIAFVRSNKGVLLTREGEELLSFSRMLLEQAEIMQEHFSVDTHSEPKFSVSCQHYSFAVNAFVDLIKQYDALQYSFILRETQTAEIIDDVATAKARSASSISPSITKA